MIFSMLIIFVRIFPSVMNFEFAITIFSIFILFSALFFLACLTANSPLQSTQLKNLSKRFVFLYIMTNAKSLNIQQGGEV